MEQQGLANMLKSGDRRFNEKESKAFVSAGGRLPEAIFIAACLDSVISIPALISATPSYTVKKKENPRLYARIAARRITNNKKIRWAKDARQWLLGDTAKGIMGNFLGLDVEASLGFLRAMWEDVDENPNRERVYCDMFITKQWETIDARERNAASD